MNSMHACSKILLCCLIIGWQLSMCFFYFGNMFLLLQGKEVGDLLSWKSLVSGQLDIILRDNTVLRLVYVLPVVLTIFSCSRSVVTSQTAEDLKFGYQGHAMHLVCSLSYSVIDQC